MKSIIGALIVFAALSCQKKNMTTSEELVQNQQITEAEALNFLARYDSAWNSKDSVTVKELLDTNYLYFDSQGGLTPRDRTLSIVAAPYYKVLSAKREEIKVIIHGNVATISSRWIGNGLWKDEPFNDNQRCGLTLAKTNGKIELIAEHCVEITKETAW